MVSLVMSTCKMNENICQEKIATNQQYTQIEIKKHILKAYIWSAALSGCETLTVGKNKKQQIKAFEI